MNLTPSIENKDRAAFNYGGKQFAIIISRFNTPITERLRTGAIDTLLGHGVQRQDIDVIWVPGALEIPFAAAKYQAMSKYDAIICLGCVIKGDTYHFEVVCNESARGISELNLQGKTPVLNGILTVYTGQQALERSEENNLNKGHEAALAALDMLVLSPVSV